MTRLWIVVGDKTTHGGTVVTGSPFTDVDGKPVARVNDTVACPKCGPTTIVTGDPTIEVDGAMVARHNDATSCGATLIAGSQFRVFVDAGGGGGSPGAGGMADTKAATKTKAAVAAAAASAARKPFDEQFRALDKSGQPVAGLPYRIEMGDGTAIRGETDDEGKTLRVATESPEDLTLYWEPVDADDGHDNNDRDLPEEC